MRFFQGKVNSLEWSKASLEFGRGICDRARHLRRSEATAFAYVFLLRLFTKDQMYESIIQGDVFDGDCRLGVGNTVVG